MVVSTIPQNILLHCKALHNRSQGMNIITDPIGSGKNTTMVSSLRKRGRYF